MRTRRWVLSVAVLAVLVPFAASAGTSVLEPTMTAVAPAEREAPAQAAFLFDVSGLPQGANRVIEEAFLEWEAPGVSSEGLTEFFAYGVTQTWSAMGVEAGTVPTYNEEEIAHWTIEPPDYAKHGGFVRLDLTALVQAWADRSATNHGIVVACPTLAAETLDGHLGTARLVVKCGYTFGAE
jgi:hypothetical protein